MAEPVAKNPNEAAGKDAGLGPFPDPIVSLVSVATEVVKATARVVETRGGDFFQAVGADRLGKFSESLSDLQRLISGSPGYRPADESVRGREKQLADYAAELGLSEDVVLGKALAFFKDAIEAERGGNMVVIVNKDYDVLTELSGFASEAPSSK